MASSSCGSRGSSLPFSAVEHFSVGEVAFSWRARFRLLTLVPLRVVDGYAAGRGRLEARLLGLVPVMRQGGQAASEGEAMRYLAEILGAARDARRPPARLA
jgi:hypothetical protein